MYSTVNSIFRISIRINCNRISDRLLCHFSVAIYEHQIKGKVFHVLNSTQRQEGVWESVGLAPCIVNLASTWRSVVSFTPQGKSPRYLLDRRRDGPQSVWDVAAGRKNFVLFGKWTPSSNRRCWENWRKEDTNFHNRKRWKPVFSWDSLCASSHADRQRFFESYKLFAANTKFTLFWLLFVV
jgi:hypothetical protein